MAAPHTHATKSRSTSLKRTSSSSAPSPPKTVTQAQFTPRTNRLASYAKSVVRQNIALHNAFPEDRDKVVWDALLGAAQSQRLTEVVTRISADDSLSMKSKEMLLKYVSVLVHLPMDTHCLAVRLGTQSAA